MSASGTKRRGRVQIAPPNLGAIDPDSGVTAERQVYALLRRALMSGMIAPGAALTGRSIAASLRLSPSPVRDALKRLEADGVVSGRDKSAYYVTEVTREVYQDVMELRMHIEGKAAADAARHSSPELVAKLRTLHDRYSSTTSVIESVRLNYLFHFEVYKMAGSPVLIDVVENLWMRMGTVMHLHMRDYDVGAVTDNHARLIDAIERRDPRSAARALERDLSEAAKIIAPKLARGGAATRRSADLVATLGLAVPFIAASGSAR